MLSLTADTKLLTFTAEKDDTGYGPFYYMLQKDTEWKAGYKYTYNVTITLYGLQVSVDTGSMTWGDGAGGGACRTITIENANFHAYGAEDEGYAATPAIGSGFPTVAFPTSIPMVTISNHSEVHAHRGGTIGNTDYIGWGGLNSYWKKESLR